MLPYSADDNITIIDNIDYSQITMNELVKYLVKQEREQKHNDYNGVVIKQQVVVALC